MFFSCTENGTIVKQAVERGEIATKEIISVPRKEMLFIVSTMWWFGTSLIRRLIRNPKKNTRTDVLLSPQLLFLQVALLCDHDQSERTLPSTHG